MKNILIVIVAFAAAVLASQIKSQVSLAVTIYNDQFAMVKDVRNIQFTQGRSDLYFTDVSSNIQPQTVTFKAIQSPESIKVFEQNFQNNLIDANSILQKYINKNILVYTRLGQNSYKYNGTLLGYSGGYILKTDSGIQVLNNIEGVHFPELPQGFFTVPTLNWKVFSQNGVTTNCQVAYRTTGFSWKSDYSVVLSNDEKQADIGGWVTIDNHSGKRYINATLKLIAGDVNTVQNSIQPQPLMMAMSSPSPAMQEAAPSFSQKSFSDYHMYTLSQPVSLNQNSQKQVEFIPKVYNITVRKYNLFTIYSGGQSQSNLKASNNIQFNNSKQNKLGIPLPKGTVRVFKTDDSDGSLQFIGQSSINHTPKDQNITLTTGNAFDITANKISTNYRSYSQGGYSADLNLTIFNHKDISAEIVINYNNYNGDNLKINWKSSDINVVTISSSLTRITKIMSANEKFSLLWDENLQV